MTDPNNPPPAGKLPGYGVQLDAALQAELDRQKAVEGGRTYTAGGTGAGFWKPQVPEKKKEAIGTSVENYILVLPTEYPVTSVVPWVQTAQHSARRQGQFFSVVCPVHDATINGITAPYGCPICDEKDRRFQEMRNTPKGSKDSDYWKEEGKKLGERDRNFLQVFDLVNMQTQNWDAEQGKPVPAIWGFGRGIMTDIRQIVGEVGPLWDPSGFTPLKVIVTRDGLEDRNIKYDLHVVIPQIRQGQIPAGYEQVLNNLADLQSLRKAGTPQELHAFLGGGAQTAGSPTGVGAPPPAMTAPGLPPNPYGAVPPAALPPAVAPAAAAPVAAHVPPVPVAAPVAHAAPVAAPAAAAPAVTYAPPAAAPAVTYAPPPAAPAVAATPVPPVQPAAAPMPAPPVAGPAAAPTPAPPVAAAMPPDPTALVAAPAAAPAPAVAPTPTAAPTSAPTLPPVPALPPIPRS